VKNRKVVVITGPTASGKSSLGIKLARRFNGEIISADSRQVYKGMDLGTGKVKIKPLENPTVQEKKLGKCLSGGIPHYLLDIADPRKEQFNMARFQKLAREAIEIILSSGKIPFIVGGTMLYIDALRKGYQPLARPDYKLRDRLKKRTLKGLLAELKDIDPETYKKIDRKNRYRIIRAIEVKKLTGQSFFISQKKTKSDFDFLVLVISRPRKELYQRIDQRIDQRISKGMVKEIRNLHSQGLSWPKMERFGLEYRYLSRYLRGQLAKDAAIEELKYQTHRYARQQLSWWRKDKQVIWIENEEEVEKLIKEFLN